MVVVVATHIHGSYFRLIYSACGSNKTSVSVSLFIPNGEIIYFFFSSNFADLSSSSCDFDQATVLFVVVISALFIAEVIASFFVFVLQDWNGLT